MSQTRQKPGFSVFSQHPLTLPALSLASALLLLAKPADAADPIHWDAPVQWTPWAQAMTKAKAENKPLCLVVYADWCPKCRKIAPFFHKPEVLAATKKAVMVLQNEDEKPDWLANEFSASGNYVPRIFCLDKGGNIDHSIQSGNQRFPFFYRPNDEGVSLLVRSIEQAVTKVGGPAQAAAPQIAAPQAAQPANVQAVGAGAAGQTGQAAVAVAPGQPQPPAEEPSDLPILLGLVAVAVGAVWFVGRTNG